MMHTTSIACALLCLAHYALDVATASGLNHEALSELIAQAPEEAADIAESAELSEEGYQSVAALHSDEMMKTYARRVLAAFDRTVLDEGELSGFVQHYSGTIAVQNFASLVAELTKVDWATHMAPPSNQAQEVAPLETLGGHGEQEDTEDTNESGSFSHHKSHHNESAHYGDSAGESQGSLSKLGGDPSATSRQHGAFTPVALQAVREAAKAEKLGRARLESVTKEVQLASKASAEAEKKVKTAAEAVAALTRAKKDADGALKAAKNKERITKMHLAKLSQKGGAAETAKATKEMHEIEADTRRAERTAKLAGEKLQHAIASKKKSETVAKARVKTATTVKTKQESAQHALQLKKHSTANATKRLRKQISKLTKLEEKEASLEAAFNATAAQLNKTHEERIRAMEKYNFTSGTRAQVLAKTSLTRSSLSKLEDKQPSRQAHGDMPARTPGAQSRGEAKKAKKAKKAAMKPKRES